MIMLTIYFCKRRYHKAIKSKTLRGLLQYLWQWRKHAEKNVCEYLSIPVLGLEVLDCFPRLTVDGLHPNDEGRREIATRILQYIKSI